MSEANSGYPQKNWYTNENPRFFAGNHLLTEIIRLADLAREGEIIIDNPLIKPDSDDSDSYSDND